MVPGMEGSRERGRKKADEVIRYRPMRPGEEAEVCRLVAEVFMEFVGRGYPPEGVREFLRYAEPSALRNRSFSNHFTLVATRHGTIVGMIEIRGCSHVCLFFVRNELQGKGIGRGLFERSLEICRNNKPESETIDVNSSPNAVGIYERLGFRAAGPEKTVNGITFVPMVLRLRESG